MSRSSKRQHTPLFVTMCVTMAILALVQSLTLAGAMIAMGGFSTIKKFSYNSLAEKTQNRAAYIENYFVEKESLVCDYADTVNSITADVLRESGKTSADIRTDKELCREILSECAESVVSLIRRNSANDAFIYLDTDELFAQDGMNRLAGFYIRDTDVYAQSSTDNGDLYLEAGSSETARRLGLTLDFEWSLYTNVTPEADLRFITEPIEQISANPQIKAENAGYWSSLSRISHSAEQSVKYSVPLVLEDGTVYGVIGIGILEKSILNNIPAVDFLNESACYVLANDFSNSGAYDVQVYSGAAYNRLVSEDTVLDESSPTDYGLYSYNTRAPSVGSICDINLYSSGTMFRDNKWVLISVADRSAVLEIYNLMTRMFVVSAAVSITLCLLCAVVVSKRVTLPVSKMIKTLEENKSETGTVRFVGSGIAEIDKLAEAIVDLQINVREQAYRVSDILTAADSGIGVFMLDFNTQNVFVGKNLVKMLDFEGLSPDEDINMPYEEFKRRLGDIDAKYDLFAGDIFAETPPTEERFGEKLEAEYQTTNAAGSRQTLWLRFTMRRDKAIVSGLIQNITEDTLNRRKMEHERDYDVTTDLFNRRGFTQRVTDLFSHPAKLGVGAFLMMDLDNLKYVNDTFGHDFGDDYIRSAANVLKTLNERGAITARLSGDEFIAFIYGARCQDDIRAIIDEFKNNLSKSYCYLADGSHYRLRASGGVSWYPENSTSYEALMKYADFAMYTIKHTTKGNIAEFDPEAYMNDEILVTGIEELNRIIDSKDIRYAFQAIIDAHTGEIFGYEALMRPQSKKIGNVGEFMRVAKSAARLYEVERLTWFLAMERFAALVKIGAVPDNARLFINSISNCILSDENIALIERDFESHLKNIVLEVLEGEEQNKEFAAKKQELVKRWGAMMALDDFGTGYNGELALITMNPGLIKIDRSIIMNCDTDSRKLLIIQNLVAIAHGRGITVLAEGVETSGETDAVISAGVDLIQGFYFARPEFEPKPISPERVAQVVKAADSVEKVV